MKEQVTLNVEELEERIVPYTVGALHNNPSYPNNNNDHNAVPNGAIPEGPAGKTQPTLGLKDGSRGFPAVCQSPEREVRIIRSNTERVNCDERANPVKRGRIGGEHRPQRAGNRRLRRPAG